MASNGLVRKIHPSSELARLNKPDNTLVNKAKKQAYNTFSFANKADFTPPLDQGVITRSAVLLHPHESGVSLAGKLSFLTLAPTAALSGGSLLAYGLMFDQIMIVITASVVTSVFSLRFASNFAARFMRRHNKRILAAYNYNENAIEYWLRKRYKVIVTPEILSQISRFISHRQAPKSKFSFVDLKGKEYTVDVTENADYFTISKVQTGNAKQVANKAKLPHLSFTAMFTDEIKDMHFDVKKQIVTLNKMNLAVENEYAVTRAIKDANNAVKTYKQMLRIDSSNTDAAVALSGVYSEIRIELDAIIKAEMDSLKNELAVQQSYIKTRREDDTSVSPIDSLK